ncbi:MAG: type II toxin-antitoxin system VapC family toxin [Acidobacteria bacterium]|nr:type II toxin-antitoxin system VapC family toxin [Acidobacteriota bacterium]
MTLPYVDTSALAKWYLNEAFSEEVEAFLQAFPAVHISSLTAVETHCLLARRRRSGEISRELEGQILELFLHDIRTGYLRAIPLHDPQTAVALQLMGRLPTPLGLRTLDALHLAIVQDAQLRTLATADRLMASAAEEIGLEVVRFFPG